MGADKQQAKKRAQRHVYLRVAMLIDPKTGQKVGAFIPDSPIDRAMIRERDYRPGQQIRAVLTAPRNVKFHRMVFGLGQVLASQCDDFDGMDAYAVIKRLQLESGQHCEETVVEVPGVGPMLFKQPQSIDFERMDESVFHQFWKAICAHIVARYWQSMDQQQIEHMIDMMPDEL